MILRGFSTSPAFYSTCNGSKDIEKVLISITPVGIAIKGIVSLLDIGHRVFPVIRVRGVYRGYNLGVIIFACVFRVRSIIPWPAVKRNPMVKPPRPAFHLCMSIYLQHDGLV